MAKVQVPIELNRAGGALCRLTVSAWRSPVADDALPADTAVLATFKVSPEHASLSLEPGAYRVACLLDVIEAVSGVYKYQYTVGKDASPDHGGKGSGDVNTTPKRDIKSFMSTFNLTVA